MISLQKSDVQKPEIKPLENVSKVCKAYKAVHL